MKKNYYCYEIALITAILFCFSGCGEEKLPDVCERVVQSGYFAESGAGFQVFFVFDGIPRSQYDTFQKELQSEQGQPPYKNVHKWIEWTEKQLKNSGKYCALIVPYEAVIKPPERGAMPPHSGAPPRKPPKFNFLYQTGPNNTLDFNFGNMWMKIKGAGAKIALPPIDGKCYLFNAKQKTFEAVDVELNALFETHKANFQEIFDDEGKNTSISTSAGSWENYYFAKQSFSYRPSILDAEWYSKLKEKMEECRVNLK